MLVNEAKPTLLFLQGGGVLPEQYNPILEMLREKYQVIYYDYPVVLEDIGKKYAKHIKDKLTEQQLADLTIVSHSLGAYIAVELCSLLTTKPRKVVLVSPLLSAIKDNVIKFTIKTLFYSKTVPSRILWFSWIKNIPLWLSQLIGVRQIDIDAKLKKLTNSERVVVITGKDKLITEQQQREKLHLLKGAKIVQVNSHHGYILHSHDLLKRLL